MDSSTNVTGRQLDRLLEATLRACLDSSGWEVAELRRDQVLGTLRQLDAWAVLRSGQHTINLIIEVRPNPRPATVRDQTLLLPRLVAEHGLQDTAVAFFVPRATSGLVEAFREAGVGFFDLQGACLLQWPGLYIERPAGSTIASRRQRAIIETARSDARLDGDTIVEIAPTGLSLFGPRPLKRQRVLRVLLSHPQRHWKQSELSAETGVDRADVNRVVTALMEEHWADYKGAGPSKEVFLTRPGDLLETWAGFWEETWKRTVRQAGLYYSLTPNPEEVMAELVSAAAATGAELGFTLAAGANRFAALLRDDVVHAWVVGDSRSLTQGLKLSEVRRGANVVLLPARDEGLLYLPENARAVVRPRAGGQVWPVSPVQLYLDMQAAGGRYAEQSERLRQEVLGY